MTSNNAESVLHTQISIEAQKFTGHDTRYIGQLLIHELISSRITILPFTIDPLGSLGPFVTAFLFRTTQTHIVPTLLPSTKKAKLPIPLPQTAPRSMCLLQRLVPNGSPYILTASLQYAKSRVD